MDWLKKLGIETLATVLLLGPIAIAVWTSNPWWVLGSVVVLILALAG